MIKGEFLGGAIALVLLEYNLWFTLLIKKGLKLVKNAHLLQQYKTHRYLVYNVCLGFINELLKIRVVADYLFLLTNH